MTANCIISFFLWLSNIPLYIHHIFFILSSVDGRLGCFHVLAIIKFYCYEHWGVYIIYFQIRVFMFYEYIPRVGLLDHMVTGPVGHAIRGKPFLRCQLEVSYLLPKMYGFVCTN